MDIHSVANPCFTGLFKAVSYICTHKSESKIKAILAIDCRVAEFLARNKQAMRSSSQTRCNLLTMEGRELAKTHQSIALLEDTLFAKGSDPRGNIVIGIRSRP